MNRIIAVHSAGGGQTSTYAHPPTYSPMANAPQDTIFAAEPYEEVRAAHSHMLIPSRRSCPPVSRHRLPPRRSHLSRCFEHILRQYGEEKVRKETRQGKFPLGEEKPAEFVRHQAAGG